MKKQDLSLDLFDLKYQLYSEHPVLSEEVMLELYGKLSDIRETTKDQLFLATCFPTLYCFIRFIQANVFASGHS